MQLLNSLLPLNAAWLQAIGWVLLHSIWQGVMAALMAGLIILLTKKSSARLRYNLLCTVFLLFLSVVGITFYQLISVKSAELVTIAGIPFLPENAVATGQTVSISAKSWWLGFATWFGTYANYFVMAWGLFFVLHCIKLASGLFAVNRLRSRHTQEVGGEWYELTWRLSNRLGIRKLVQVKESVRVKVPVVIGHFRPVILVPVGLLMQLPAEQAETILLHELAHIRRCDYLVNFLQCITEAVFFFNPGLCWISSLIRQEREACCDDIVVTNTRHTGSYLEALVSFQEYAISHDTAMAIVPRRDHLLSRVRRMLTRENKKLNAMEKLLLLSAVALLTAFGVVPGNEPPPALTNITAATSSVFTSMMSPMPERPKESLPRRTVPRRAVISSSAKTIKETPVTVGLTDTLPTPSNPEKSKPEKTFPNVSRTINDDGTNSKEVTTATHKDGKVYSVSRLNGKITQLSVDGKEVPEADYPKYKEVLGELGRQIDKSRTWTAVNRQDRVRIERTRPVVIRKRNHQNTIRHQREQRNRQIQSRWKMEQRQIRLQKERIERQEKRKSQEDKPGEKENPSWKLKPGKQTDDKDKKDNSGIIEPQTPLKPARVERLLTESRIHVNHFAVAAVVDKFQMERKYTFSKEIVLNTASKFASVPLSLTHKKAVDYIPPVFQVNPSL